MPPHVDSIGKAAAWLGRNRDRSVAWLPSLPEGWCRRGPLPSRPLIVVAVALAVGTLLGLTVALVAPACWSAAVVALVSWGLLARRGHPSAGPVLLAAVALTGAGWATARWRLFPADDLAWMLGDRPQPIVVEGRLLDAARERPRSADPLRGGSLPPTSECLLEVTAVRDGETWRRAGGRAVLVIDGPAPACAVDTRVLVWGRGSCPMAPGNPGEFDKRARARQERTLSIIRVCGAEYLEEVARPSRLTIGGFLDSLRSRGEGALAAHLSPARAPLASALILGTREGLAGNATEPFMVTGTVHILSISGLHVAFLAGGLFVVARFARIPRGAALVAVALVTGLYMVLVGAQTPVLRATLVVWLACLGGAFGRRSAGINALATAAILVLVWHPPELLRIGSQLSFLSTAVLVAAAGARAAGRRDDDPIARLIDRSRYPLERWLRRRGRDLTDMLLVGAAVWLASSPLVASSFHVVSPVGLVLNPLIAPLVGLAMVGGFVCLLAAPCSSTLAGLGGAVCDGALAILDLAVGLAARIPGAFAWVAGPPLWWTMGWYVGMVGMFLVLAGPRLVRPVTWAGAAALWAGVGMLASAIPAPKPASLGMIAAAMGHGCGIVVQGPGGRVLVYDAGRLGAGVAAGRGISAVLWSEGVGRIDTLVISHADTDHFNGVPDLIERFSVGRVVVPGAFLESPSPAVEAIVKAIRSAGIPLTVAHAGDEIPFDPLCRVRVLHPAAAGIGPDARGSQVGADPRGPSDNETSLVMSVESAGRRILLTGDLEGPALDRFVAAGPGACDVLIAPHHGSLASLPAALARATTPRYVIVSGVEGPRWEEVRRGYESAAGADAPAQVVRTDGAVRLRLSASRLDVSQFRGGRWRALAPRSAPAPIAEGVSAGGPDDVEAAATAPLTSSSGHYRDSSFPPPASGG